MVIVLPLEGFFADDLILTGFCLKLHYSSGLLKITYFNGHSDLRFKFGRQTQIDRRSRSETLG